MGGRAVTQQEREFFEKVVSVIVTVLSVLLIAASLYRGFAR